MTAAEPRRTRNTELGDRACFCADCGWARRFMPGVVAPPETCPVCDGAIIAACSECGEDVLSIMAVECDVCGAKLRAPTVADGVQIRRSKRLPLAPSSQGNGTCAG